MSREISYRMAFIAMAMKQIFGCVPDLIEGIVAVHPLVPVLSASLQVNNQTDF